ncbi:MAG TPA: hypothetical protein VHE55_09750 [Fimbriimonadaceae bacterium]|nr:hypothetical protein [Fimbriimonadaceae bacterium]
MHNDFLRAHGLIDNHRKLAVGNLKRCPVCSTVNARLNHECFVCRWHGEFDTDPASVEQGLVDVLEQCPELIDCILHTPLKRESMFSRIRGWFHRRTSKSLDLSA